VAEIPLACSDELAAVEFFEKQRWGATPCCVKCGSVEVYKMADAKTGERNSRYLWRCRDCKEQYTVRIGTVYEESRIRTAALGLCVLASLHFEERCLRSGDQTPLPDQLQVRLVLDEPHPVRDGSRPSNRSAIDRNR
jgi:transposase-like protein